MCGIAGFLSFEAPPDRAVLERMTRAIAHRGPDDEGHHLEGPAALGFRRLSIIDLSSGHQPMTAQGCTVVFNGEIYNYQPIRAELEKKGHVFHTTSDTEVLLHAYLEWETACVDRLEGMFAFALWNPRKRQLFAARDRFGKKPFYWARVGTTFLFGSELKALVQHPLCPRKLDGAALRRYLAFEYVPTPDSIFEGVHKLEASSALLVDERGVTERRFDPLPEPEARPLLDGLTPRSVDEAALKLRELLAAAVKRRLVSDVPLGVFLSGGIDSSAVTAFAAREVSRLKTFSIGFEEGTFDESHHARRAADAFGTDHYEQRLSSRDCLDLVPTLAEQLDEPFADSSYVPTFLLSRFTRQKVTVALGGDGADELFAGYDTFVAHPAGQVWGSVPRAMQQLAWAFAKKLPTSTGYMSLDFKVKTFLKGASYDEPYRHQAWIGSFTPDAIQGLLQPHWRSPGDPLRDVYAPIDAFQALTRATGLDRALRYYIHTYLKDDILVKVDRASMAASLEVRAPFLDRELSRWVVTLPTALKLRGLERKWLLKRALRGIVPDELLDRKKHGFALPVATWLRGPLLPLLNDLLSASSLAQTGIFEPVAVRTLIEEHAQGLADHRKQLWTILMFELWRRRWAVGAPG